MNPFWTDEYIIIIIMIYLIAIPSECTFSEYKVEGQRANVIFPYPCDSTETTLQLSNGWPFYSSTDGSPLLLPENQVQRFKVTNIINNGSCSLDLTIRDLKRDDQGTYILFVYKNGNKLGDNTHKVWLQVDYPPGKASCVVGVDKGGDWVVLDCTANAGTIPGKIECYQNGIWMPPLTDPVENGSLVGQFILIRKSEPAFCCSSSLFGDKPRCECNDTILNLDDNESNHPCPLPSETPTTHHPPIVIENNPSDNYSTTTSTLTNNMREYSYNKEVITLSCLFSITFLLLVSSLFCLYKMKMRNGNVKNRNNNYTIQDSTKKFLEGQAVENRSMRENGLMMASELIKENTQIDQLNSIIRLI